MKFGVCLVVVLVLAGCSARGPYNVDPDGAHAKAGASAREAQARSLDEFIARVRALAAEARPARTGAARLEETDAPLAAALALAAIDRSPVALRMVAREYRRLGVVDKAHEYLQRALDLDGADGATYDQLARLWRDSGVPGVALPDAHRAVYYAPESAVARNTLGTVLQALGQAQAARLQYEQAVRLDPGAAYAFNNLCYAWLLDANLRRAAEACDTAIALDPSMAAARNNRGLVHALGGELGDARAAFAAGGDPAAALYNLGIVHLANRRYTDAVSAFAAAHQARPSWRLAAVRARQAGELAAGVEEE